MKKFLSLVLVVVMLLSFAIPCFADDKEIKAVYWMKNIPGDVKLSSLNIPGTHDSGMCYSQWMTGLFAETQDLAIPDQLKAGARIFDIRLRYAGNGQLNLCHGKGSYCCDAKIDGSGPFSGVVTYEKVLAMFDEFLTASNNSEAIIITVQHESGAEDKKDTPNQNDNEVFMSAFDDLNKKYPDRIIKYNPGREYICVAHNANNVNEKYTVYIYKDYKNLCGVDGAYMLPSGKSAIVPDGWNKNTSNARDYAAVFEDAVKDSEYSNLVVEGVIGTRIAHRCDITMEEARGKIIMYPYGLGFGDLMEPVYNQYDLTGSCKWEVLRPFLDGAEDQKSKYDNGSLRAAYTSCTNQYFLDDDGDKWWYGIPYPDARNAADTVNEYLMNYNFIKGNHYGWFDMDFITPALCAQIYNANIFVGEENLTYYISDIRGFCGDEDADDLHDLDETLNLCRDAGYIPLATGDIVNVNPKGYNMVIGYKLTTNPNEAITDIKGAYGDNCPKAYTKVITKNSVYNYFTRGAGYSATRTYLYYVKQKGKTPITALEILSGTTGNVTKSDKTDFNLNDGTTETIGLNMVYADNGIKTSENDTPTYNTNVASVIVNSVKVTNMIIMAIVIIGIAAIVIIKTKMGKKGK